MFFAVLLHDLFDVLWPTEYAWPTKQAWFFIVGVLKFRLVIFPRSLYLLFAD